MKHTLSLIALAVICSAIMVSCRNGNKKNESQEPTQEEIQEQKEVLADSVLAKIDEIVEQYIKVSDDADIFFNITLTDEEKMVKPDYLLEPSEVSKFVTKEQKTNALAIYDMEYFVRLLYDMPVDDVKEVVAKLAVELNHPIDGDFLTSDKLVSELIREEYNACKERGELAYFWQFESAILRETDYLIAKNPELFLNKIGEKSLSAYNEQWHNLYRAIWSLAPYDNEIDAIAKTLETKNEDEYSDGVLAYFSDIEAAVKTYKSDVYKAVEKRNALLQ